MKNSICWLIFSAVVISGCIKVVGTTEPTATSGPTEDFDIPIRVAWENDLESVSIIAAVDNVNDRIGCEVLKPVSKWQDHDVIVESGEFMPCDRVDGWDVHKDDAANVYFCGEGTAEINVMEYGTITELRIIMEHEFGHVLGLEHDPEYLFRHKHVVSSMVPGSHYMHIRNKTDEFGFPKVDERPRRISDKDAEYLHQKYCTN